MSELPGRLLTEWSSTGASATAFLLSSSTSLAPSSFPTPAPSPQFPDHSQDDGKCELLGPFALLVQVALGALALLVLVYKRCKERPQRPVKVWAFDVSKQVFGSAMLHLANLLASMFSADQIPINPTYHPNPCSYYLLNLGIDTTLGIPILVIILRVLSSAALYTPLANPPESIESGYYGHPPNAVWWFKQSVIYFVGLLGMKTCVFFIIYLLPFIVKVGDWALRWTEGNTAVQIFFVMLLFPVIMNAIQYYIIDAFIKKPLVASKDSALDSESSLHDDDRHYRAALLADVDDEENSGESGGEDDDDGGSYGVGDDDGEATIIASEISGK